MIDLEQLSRTVGLFQTDFGISDPLIILQALKNTTVAIIASPAVAGSSAGQTAITTAAMLMARSGHRVYVDAPNMPMFGNQPPFENTSLHSAIVNVGSKLIDGIPINIGLPPAQANITFHLGENYKFSVLPASRNMSVGVTNWAASIKEFPQQQAWASADWPMGGMAAAVLMAAETIKVSAKMLLPLSPYAKALRLFFEELPEASLKLAPPDTPLVAGLGHMDLISAGAVSNAFLYAMLRLPEIKGQIRSFDRDFSDHSNLNRNVLLTSDQVAGSKVSLFSCYATKDLKIVPVPAHYPLDGSIPLAKQVVVGVDDIPARWALARLSPMWMGVGATTHFSSMASVHYGHSACAACLHPHNEADNGPTPTIAFASFLSGLLVAADLIIELGGQNIAFRSKQRYLNSLNPAGIWTSKVAPNPECPAQCTVSQTLAA